MTCENHAHDNDDPDAGLVRSDPSVTEQQATSEARSELEQAWQWAARLQTRRWQTPSEALYEQELAFQRAEEQSAVEPPDDDDPDVPDDDDPDVRPLTIASDSERAGCSAEWLVTGGSQSKNIC